METTHTVPVGYDLRPAYYDKFQCLAGDCRLTCCKGWRITFDKKDFMSMKQQTGSPEFNSRMSGALRRIRNGVLHENGYYGEIHLKENGSCPLQCENGLCILQLEKGHTALPQVCRGFPRIEIPFLSGFLEKSLGPACEGVLALLWDLPEGVDFYSDPLPQSKVLRVPTKQFGPLAPHFQEIRSQCIDFLQDRRFSLPQRILLMGLALKSLADGETDLSRWTADVQLLLEQAVSKGVSLGEENDQSLMMFLSNHVRHLPLLPQKYDDFAAVPQELLEALIIGGTSEHGAARVEVSTIPYLNARDRYQERFGGRDYFMENLMVSIFFHLHFPVVDSPEGLWKS
ncbi:MAG: flagellin lysine-N-methylase, partial [Oscillospiraceae bacterium]|nr:flagellin lysine-N-methylase [Oscillospiraceae bacterium]